MTQKFKGSQAVLLVYGLFIAVSALLILRGTLLSPSEPGNTLLLGLSLPRLVFALGLSFAFIFFTYLTIKSAGNKEWAEKTLERWFGENGLSRGLIWLTGISFGLSWIGCFLPDYRLGILTNYWFRIRPAMVFVLLTSIATLLVFFIKRNKLSIQELKNSKTLKLSLVLFLISLLVLGTMLFSRFGVHSSDDLWYGAGIPILVPQLIAGILGGLIFMPFERQRPEPVEGKWNSKRSDLVIFILIYAVTAFFWAREPLHGSFLFTDPYPPNNAWYPFADAATFDTASQFPLIGERILIFNRHFSERPLYLSLLVYLHTFFGQDYETLMAAQAGIFAVFPALIYLIGRSLNTRSMGFATAIIASLRGVNSIAASNLIDMANPKMILTDFPTAIGVALIVLLTCEWLKMPGQKWRYTLWLGGAIGLTLMLRTNALMLLALIPLYAIFRFHPEWKKWLFHFLLVGIAIIAVTLPWELRNKSLGGRMYGPILAKFQSVIHQRYTPPPQPDGSLPQKLSSVSSLKSVQTLVLLSQNISSTQNSQSCDTIICFTSNHFLHNILTSALIFPTSPVLDNLRHTVKENFPPYWRQDWDGEFTALSLVLFCINIFFIVLGISIVWQKHRFHGLAPLAIFVFYGLSNAFARTSGGRYIVPIDWIFLLYFLLGVFGAIIGSANTLGVNWKLFSNPPEQETLENKPSKINPSKAIIILMILFGLGLLIPLSEYLHPKAYGKINPAKTLIEYETDITNAGMDIRSIESFLKNQDAKIFIGRALYPRHYEENQGEIHFYPVIAMGFPRTTFTLIGDMGEQGVVLPGGITEYFPHGSDVIAVGCKNKNYLDALFVIVLGDHDQLYTRSPASDLQCPLTQPICNNNGICR